MKKSEYFKKKITNKLKDFFRVRLLNDAFAILGEPPCDYDLRAMGSFGREEICPYSDLEWMILIRNNQNKDRINQDDDKINQEKEIYNQHISFFKTLASFIELQVVSLGETAAANFPVFTSLGAKNSSGFHIDTGGNPAQDDLIGCPEKMASLQIPINHDQDYDPRNTSHTMLKTISLHQTTPNLFDQYQNCMDEILNKELPEDEKTSALSALTVRERKALKLIEKRLADYKKAWKVHFEEHEKINIKEQYIEVLQHLISDLALFYGIKETNTLDIIGSLKEKQIFTEESSILLKEAISFIYMLRVRIHLEYKEQKEEVYIGAKQSGVCIGTQGAYSQPQNDLNLLHLRSNATEKLAEIYWLVIKPIFFKISKSFSGFKKQFTRISLPEASLEESLGCENESEAEKIRSICKYLVTYYIRKKKLVEVHWNYKELSKESIFEPLRACYLQTLREKKQLETVDILSFIPNKNGLIRYHVEAYQKLQDSLRQITTNSRSAVLIKSPTLQTPLYLRPEFVNKIIDKDGNIKREYNNSLHRVCCLKNNLIDLHFKQKPNHPLMEYAIHDLTSRLTGEETPPSELLRFEVTINKDKTIVYPVLVSQTISGTSLKEVLSANPRYKPNPKCLTRMLLNAICTRPGDGRSSNFVVNNEKLYCIDNDVAFVEPIVREGEVRNTNFCSILFCLESQLLDIDVLKKFTLIDINSIFKYWLEALVKKEELYRSLFTKKEEKQLYEEDQENKFTPTILLPTGMITTLYTQIHILQHFLKDFLQKFQQDSQNCQLFPVDLLDNLITLKGEDGTTSQIGGRIYGQYKDASTLSSPEERLKKATNRKAEQSLTNKEAIKASLGKTPTIQEIQKRGKFSLEQAQEEFTKYSLFISEGGFTLGIQGEKQALSANFAKIVQGKNPDIERQELMLRGLDFVFSSHKEKPVSVTLTNCAVLDNKKLNTFLHNELKYLDLRYSLVKADMVEAISSRCTNLQELYLSECNQLQAVSCGRFISSRPLSFPQLEVFHISRCDNLVKLTISAPELRFLKANTNVKLNEINIAELCPKLKELNLSGCNQIQALEDIHGEPLSFPNLDFLDIAKCDNLKRLKINAPELRVLKANTNVNLNDLSIAELCPKLEELYLSECHKIQALEDSHGKLLNFPNLDVLHIAKCNNLERLKIDAPELRVLKADNNVKLKKIIVTSFLEELNVENCPLLTEQPLITDQAKQVSLDKTPTIGEVQERKKSPLKQTQEKLMGYASSKNRGGAILSIKNGKITFSADFERIHDVKPGRQDSILKQALDFASSDQKKKLISITLTKCDVLDNAKLIPILHNELKYLDLQKSLVKADMVETISFRCTNLQELYLSGCNQLQAVEKGGSSVFSEPLLSFPKLEVFHIAGCNVLERLQINAPKLRVLKASNNVKLNDLNIAAFCTNLQKLYLSKCNKIQSVDWRRSVFSELFILPKLEVFHIAGCDNLGKLKINAPNLRVLKANNNVKLKVFNISKSCEGIEELNLSECHLIQALEDSDKKNLNFPKLKVLHIAGCNNLVRLKISAPNLQVLKANNNVKLNDLNMFELCTNLKELYLSECHRIQALEYSHRQPFNFPELEVLHIDKCDNLERLHIDVPKLRALKADNNAKLNEMVVTSSTSMELNVENCPLLTEVVFRDEAFGKKEWEKYFGEVGEEPPLPANIEEILNEPCPFWENKKVKETHLLVLIPNTINGKPFTMNYLGELIQNLESGHSTKYGYYYNGAKEAVGDKSYPSHWVLMTRDIIPGSRGKSYSDCCGLIANHSKETGFPYGLPHLLEATASILMHYVRTGERLYSENPRTDLYSQDVDKDNALVVGSFASGGLNVHGRVDFRCCGVAGCRRFLVFGNRNIFGAWNIISNLAEGIVLPVWLRIC